MFFFTELFFKGKIYRAITCFLFVIIPFVSSAGLFFEHKLIGDSAFKEFIRRNNLEYFFRDTLHLRQFGSAIPIPFHKNELVKNYYNGLFAFAGQSNAPFVSYGDLTGLSADHSLDANQLFKGLFVKALFTEECPGLEKYSVLMSQVRKAMQLHFQAIDEGKREGSFFSFKYALLAAEDQSHFLRPPQGLEEMLSQVDTAFINLTYNLFAHGCNDRDSIIYQYRKLFDKKILFINNPTKYALLHAVALHFINIAAIDYDENPEMVEKDVKTAFLFNAFADHFLQDEFASGHLCVQRNWRGLNNKGTHDYYNRVGLNVMNRKGERWRTYGDGSYDDTTYRHAIDANVQSLQELWDQFDNTRRKVWAEIEADTQVAHPSLFDTLHTGKILPSQFVDHIVTDFKAWDYIPIPLNDSSYKLNRLKNNSKSGGYLDFGYARGFDFSGDHKHYVLSAAISPIGYLLKQPGKNERESIESIIWFGFGFAFNHVQYDGFKKNQLMIKIPVSFYDKIMTEVAIGGSRYDNKNHLLCMSSIGYEWKILENCWAPSLNYFISFEKGSIPVQGIKLNLRLY